MFIVALCVDAVFFVFFFNDTATTEIYTLSLHDALPIFIRECCSFVAAIQYDCGANSLRSEEHTSELQSHSFISYAVFCLKKKTYNGAAGLSVDWLWLGHRFMGSGSA